jgi:hypothetical protein
MEPLPLGLVTGPPVVSHQSSCWSSDLMSVLPLQVSGAHIGLRNIKAMKPLLIGLATGPALTGHQSSCQSPDLALILPLQVSVVHHL